MSIDINARVLAAFQSEHKEQLEGIRALLVHLESDKTLENTDCIDEVFRLAHSLKGGARVCDLRPAEMLAHGLENVFERVRGGQMCLNEVVIKTVNVVLDAIEDWMASLGRDGIPADPRQALTAVERLLNADAQDNASKRIAEDDVAQQLLNAFRQECPQYLVGLRQFAATLDDQGGEVMSDVLENAYRLAYNLRISAHAAEIEPLKHPGAAVESLLADFCERSTIPGEAARNQLTQHLDTIEREIDLLVGTCGAAHSTAPHSQDTSTTDSVASETVKAFSAESANPTTSMRTTDTVRISTESLDRLLRSTRELVGESVRQERMSQELDEVRRQANQMLRERESIRRIAATSLHRMTTMPEFNRLANYFETVDRGIQSLARRTRQLCAVHKRNAWRLQSRGRQIQQDVRQARMVPAEEVYQGLRKLVRDLAKEEGKQVEFRVTGFDVQADRMVFQALKDPLIHMLRNCIVHGIESPTARAAAGKSVTCRIELRIETLGNRLTIEVDDDGRGIDREKIARRAIEQGLISQTALAERSAEQTEQLIFQPGFSTVDQVTEIAGRGMGLSVVREAVTRLQGDVLVCQNAMAGTRFRISVPTCVSTHRLLLVSAGNQTYAIPLRGIERLLRVKASDMETIEGNPVVTFQGRIVPLVSLANSLGLDGAGLEVNGDILQIAILKSSTRRMAVSVDAILAEKNLLIQDLDESAACQTYLGAVLLEDDNVALVLNPTELLERADPAVGKIIVERAVSKVVKRTRRVLVVDDSFTTRTLEKSILEANGYEVGIAVDGVEGLNQLKSEHYDLVISDVEMPRMDGFALLAEIKKDHRLASIPVIMVTSRDRPEDRERGLDLGADAYIVKQKFDHQSLLSTIRQIVDV